MSAGFVYLLAADNGLTKIGRSKKPLKRLSQFASGPVDVSLIHQIQTDNMVWLEGYLHGRYAASRARKEWFRLSPQDLAELTAVHEWNIPEHSKGRWNKRVVFFVPADLAAVIDAEARRKGISRTAEIILALEEALKALGEWPPKS